MQLLVNCCPAVNSNRDHARHISTSSHEHIRHTTPLLISFNPCTTPCHEHVCAHPGSSKLLRTLSHKLSGCLISLQVCLSKRAWLNALKSLKLVHLATNQPWKADRELVRPRSITTLLMYVRRSPYLWIWCRRSYTDLTKVHQSKGAGCSREQCRAPTRIM